jgi:hypothetical protein
MDVGIENLRDLSGKRAFLFASRPAAYILILLVAAVTTFTYRLRAEGIFSCQADGYTSDNYLAACNGGDYGDYEHGAFWFDMEPKAWSFARDADVLFLGNSRLMIAVSTPATPEWFASLPARYYLLGFSYNGNVNFTELLLRKIQVQPQVYVINVDNFFIRSKTLPAKIVTEDPQAQNRYEVKRRWQLIHKPVCNTIPLPIVCGHKYAVFRSRETGAYKPSLSPRTKKAPVSYDATIDQNKVDIDILSANEFLSSLSVKRECILLTMVPFVGTNIAAASAVANAVGSKLVIPPALDGLQTMDGYHLDKTSSERWSRAFFQTAGTQIQECLHKSQVPRS